jgi:chromate transporter
MLIVLGFSWVYVRYNTTPQLQLILASIKPVIIVFILQALWLLAKKAIQSGWSALLALLLVALYFFGLSEILILIAGGLIYWLGKRLSTASLKIGYWLPVFSIPVNLFQISEPVSISLTSLYLSFFKIGAILYGSGYVLFAFLRAEFVVRLPWLTDQQLIDAIAIGQVTPGPLFTTATFIGYLLAGLPGSLVATAGIFTPAMIFVALSIPLLARMRKSVTLARFLDGVNLGSLALMAAVTWNLGRSAIFDLYTFLLALLAGVLLFKYKISATRLVIIGIIFGLLNHFLL